MEKQITRQYDNITYIINNEEITRGNIIQRIRNEAINYFKVNPSETGYKYYNLWFKKEEFQNI